MKFLILFFLLLTANQCFSQTIFKEEEFIAVVKKYHPMAKLASLQVSAAKADLISKQGAFDPVVTAENTRKDFGGVAYYNNQDATIKIVPGGI